MADCNAVNQIIQHELFRAELTDIERLEKERIFCRHGIEHLLTVAHLAWVEVLECGLEGEVSKPVLYAAALLHDIGRGEQYRTGTPHDKAGVSIAKRILAECDFTARECEEILTAIAAHRAKGEQRTTLAEVLYRADKACRPCFFCAAAEQCNWSMEKRNLQLKL